MCLHTVQNVPQKPVRVYNLKITCFYLSSDVTRILRSASKRCLARQSMPENRREREEMAGGSSENLQGVVVEDLGGLRAYTVGAEDSKAVIVLVSDIHGFEAPSLRKLADKVAAAGFFVVAPDFFHGDPISDKVDRQVWRAAHGTDKGFEESKPVVEALKVRGASWIGAAGFCWGGKVVVNLAKTDAINAAVLLHPSRVTVDDIKEVKTPISVLGAENDKSTSPELVKQYEEILNSLQVDSFVKIFPGVGHGWTMRYGGDDEEANKKAEEAHQDMLDWFVKHLK